MTMDVPEFAALCSEIMTMVESLGDEVIRPSESATFESLDEFSEDAVIDAGDEFVFGIDVDRNGVIYTILGSPKYEYFEIIFQHSLTDSLIIQSTLTSEEQETLSEEERSERISEADLDFDELQELLSESRNAPVDVIESRVYNEMSSQTDCSFQVTHTDSGDVLAIEATRKLFVQDDDFSKSTLEDAIVSVTNIGKNAIFLLSDLYDVESVTPDALLDVRGKDGSEQSRYHQ